MSTARDYAFKYDKRGISTPQNKLHPGEPWFFLRAQDKLASYAVQAYAEALSKASSRAVIEGDFELAESLIKQAIGCQKVAQAFEEWMLDNPSLVKWPD